MQSCCVDSVMGGMEPVCRAHLRWEVMRAAPFPAGCAGATWRLSVVCLRKTTEPPAHCRLVSDHDLFEIVALLDCTVSMTARLDRGRGERCCCPGHSFGETEASTFPRSRHAIACARTVAAVKAGQSAARFAGRLDGRGSRRAKIICKERSMPRRCSQRGNDRDPKGRGALIAGLGRAIGSERDRA
jgi:hypothetical protein